MAAWRARSHPSSRRCLPRATSEIIKRFYLDEEDKAEICRSMGLSPLHFDRVIFRARQRLRSLTGSEGLRQVGLLLSRY